MILENQNHPQWQLFIYDDYSDTLQLSHIGTTPPTGFEPVTHWLTASCSTF